MYKNKVVIAIFFVILIASSFAFRNIISGRVEDASIYPLIVIEESASKVSGFFRRLLFAPDSEGKLREKLGELARDRTSCVEAELENARLREALQLKSERPDYFTAAEVFARDHSNWFQTLWIDKGFNDGVKKDMIAATRSGVIGRTHKVLGDRASIVLISDVNSAVAVRLQASRAEGILEGRGGRTCYLKYIPSDVKVETGDAVISSGLDGLFPDGLLLGYVADIVSSDAGIFHVIEVKPAQELDVIEEVSLLGR
ncbi:MAG: rod shape-determining protein MreC [Nitrospirae bacterium]|nr:rod shape-determining protein MreC [Nitrospirota bacterium]